MLAVDPEIAEPAARVPVATLDVGALPAGIEDWIGRQLRVKSVS
jgi:hypothetical protein